MAINVELPSGMESLLRDKDNVSIDVRIGDYLNTEFLVQYTNFNSYEEFIDFSPYTEKELSENPELFNTPKMDRYIELTTQFESFEAMFAFAVQMKLEGFFENKN